MSDIHRNRRTSTKMMLIAGSGWLRIVLTLLVTLYLTPLLISELGLALYGVFMFVAITMLMNAPMRAAVGKTLTRELTAAISASDARRTREVFTNGWCIAAIAAAIAGIVGTVLVVVVPAAFNFSPQHTSYVRLALICEVVLAVEMFLLAPFKNLYLATHRHMQENANRTIERCLDLISALIAFYILRFDPFVAFIVSRVVMRSLFNIRKAFVISRAVPDARFTPSMIDRRVMKKLAATGGWAMGNSVSRLGYYLSDQVLLNLFFGPLYNGIYAIINQLRAYTRMFGGNVSFGVESVSTDLHSRGQAASTRMLLLATMKFTLAVTLLFGALIGVFAGPLMEAWLGNRLVESEHELAQVGLTVESAIVFAWVFIGILIPGVVLAEMNVAATNVLYGMGHEKSFAPALFAGAILKIALALVLLIGLGAGPMALAWSTAVVQILVFGVYFPYLIRRLTGISLLDQYKVTYLRPLAAVAPVVGIGLWMSLNLGPWRPPAGAPTLSFELLKVGACMGVLGVLWAGLAFLFVFNAHERARVLGLAAPVLRRIGLGRFAPKAAPKRGGGKRRAGAGALSDEAAATASSAPGDDPSRAPQAPPSAQP
ncbi:MAG: polysaccharide biosynthesis protein [Phycisphaerales bacterium]|nr:MAG: polysaccharide biosynthesis protein [Phycisphaerales bacterium]